MKEFAEKKQKKEIIPILIRRIILPFYIPVIALICSLLLLKNNKTYLNKISVFFLFFYRISFTELIIRYTGLNQFLRVLYFVTPITLLVIFYIFLNYKFSRETK